MIWSLPIRIFHWGFAVSIIAAYLTGENGNMFWHELSGLAALGFFIFRVLWGFIGAEESHFKNLFYAPKIYFIYIWQFLRRQTPEYKGHNPTGGLAVSALLALMGAMAITGLWTNDDVLYEAPLTILAPDFFPRAGYWHAQLHKAVIPLIALHIFAIIVHRLWLKEKLLKRMINPLNRTGGGNTPHKKGLGLLFICVVAALALALITPNY